MLFLVLILVCFNVKRHSTSLSIRFICEGIKSTFHNITPPKLSCVFIRGEIKLTGI